MNHTAPAEIPSRSEAIRAQAYLLWQQANRPPNQELDFWLQAEQQLAAKQRPESGQPEAATNHRKRRKAEPKAAAGTKRAASPNGNGAKKRPPGTPKPRAKQR